MAEEASPPPPPPPPPPPAAKAGVSQGAVLSAIRKVANVPSLITSLIIRASCFRMRAIPPAARVNPALLETFPPERFFQRISKWNANKHGRRRSTMRQPYQYFINDLEWNLGRLGARGPSNGQARQRFSLDQA